MDFNEDSMLYSEDKTLTIKTPKAFFKKNLKEIKTVCSISENIEEDFTTYTVENITDYNRFLYFISREIVNSIVLNYLKPKLKEAFPKDYKRIFDNHQKYSYENNYSEFFVKARLLFFFKFNDTLNIPTFIKFNCNKLYEEFDLIVETEIEVDGGLYEDMDTINILSGDEEVIDLTERFNALFNYISGKEIKKKIEDIHIFKDGNKFFIINEKGSILNSGQTGLDFIDVKDYYKDVCNKEADELESLGFYLSMIIALANPERIILYNSIEEEFKNQVFVDVGIIKQVLNLQTEIYTSEEKKPRL